MEFMWFYLGAFLILTFWAFLAWFKRAKRKLSWLSWIGFIFSVILGFFTIAWAVSCLIEGEEKAAVMGLVIFGLMSSILLVLSLKKKKM